MSTNLTNSQKKLLQKYDLLDQIDEILSNLNSQNNPQNSVSLEQTEQKIESENTKIQKIESLKNLLGGLFDKEKLQKIFETKIIQKNQKQKNLENSSIALSKKNRTQAIQNKKQIQNLIPNRNLNTNYKNLFDDEYWREFILPHIEHPQFTKPQVWKNRSVPSVLLGGNHLAIQKWRQFDWKNIDQI